MAISVSLLNLVVKECVSDTLIGSLPRLWNLGKQRFAQLEENWWQNLKKQQGKYAFEKRFIICYISFHSYQFFFSQSERNWFKNKQWKVKIKQDEIL